MPASDQTVCLLGPFRTESISGRFDRATRDRLRPLPGTGGSGLVALAQARLNAGLPTEIITLDPRLAVTEQPVVCQTEGLKYTICPRRPRHVVRDFFRHERRHLSNAIANTRASCLHAHWTYEYALAAIDSGLPSLVTVRDNAGHILQHEGLRFLGHYLAARIVFQRHRDFSAVSPPVAEYVARHVRRPVPVIGNPMPFPRPALQPIGQHPFSDGRCVILSAASWAHFKNIRRALQAFVVFRQNAPGAIYRLFGPDLGSNGDAARWAKRHGLEAGVEFRGLRPHTELLENFRDCDLVWHPSIEESFGNPVLEALSFAKPILASRQAAGSCWLIEHNRTGILTDGTSPAAMASALLDLYRHPDRTAELANQGQRSVVSRFAPDTILAAYAKEYLRITSPNKALNNINKLI